MKQSAYFEKFNLIFLFKNNFVFLIKKNFRIVVVDFYERNRVSLFVRISKMILPLLISFTIGTFIYQGLGPDGSIFNALYPYINRPLTDPSKLGVFTPDMISPKEIWIEIGRFARYCIMPMIIIYIALTIIIPGAWLLDDAGICFYEKSLKSREISDIDSVSRFFLSLISGLKTLNIKIKKMKEK
ncbi:MAG: hypothetical protein ACTSRZ_03460 [Promethearchaeota archaeon]